MQKLYGTNLRLGWERKRKVPSESEMKTKSESGVDTPYSQRSPIENTNSVGVIYGNEKSECPEKSSNLFSQTGSENKNR